MIVETMLGNRYLAGGEWLLDEAEQDKMKSAPEEN